MMHTRFREVFGQSDQTSFDAIKNSNADLVVATAFPFPPNNDQLHESVPDLISEELRLYREYVAVHKAWHIVCSADELREQKKKLLLHIEGLNVFNGSERSWQQLSEWIDLGVRSVGTHWNIENKLGGGTLRPELPLTYLGAEVLAYLEDHSCVLDMAHMGRHTFWDAVKVVRRPLYVSHGNADAICPDVRNYTDAQLKVIAETDGVIGVFFSSKFVVGKDKQGTIQDVIAHITYIKNLIGIRHIAIGSDFGGITSRGITNLAHVADMPNLFTALRQNGYSEEDVRAIASANALRVLCIHLE